MNRLFGMQGRFSRSNYLWSTIIITLVTYGSAFAVGLLMGFSGAGEDAAGAVGFLIGACAAVLIAFQAVKRLHDLGRPGTHYWLFFIPLYNVYIGLVLLFQKGIEGSNAYGADPTA